jgi:D-alanyl-D-alanine carboxypeptidase
MLGTAVPASAAATPDTLHVRADRILSAWPSSAVAIVDPTSGRLFYGKNADKPLPAASLLKMVTAILVAERLHADDRVTISSAAGHARDDQIAWRQGATFTVDQVLHGMLMESSNGAAIALAQRMAGSLPAFARLADARAAQLGATHTRIVDPSGLDARGQHASARDLALIASAFLKIPWLAHVAVTKDYSIPWPDGTTARLGNLDRFVNAYPGAVGVKNGYTSVAGNCVAAAATHRGKTLIVVVLNASHVYDSAARLMDAGFATSTIATWEPDHLPVEAPAGVDSAPARAAAKTEEVATVKHGGGHSTIQIIIILMLVAYGARVTQIRRRRIRRTRARRRARIEATRANIEARYAKPVGTPRALPLRERDESPRTSGSSYR